MNIIELLTILQALSIPEPGAKCKNGTKATIQLRKESIEDNQLKLLNADICGSSLGDRIIGGVNASLGQYPWIASLGYAFPDNLLAEPTFRCGAALINSCFVVTAGHCVSHGRNEMTVSVIRLGEHNMMTDIDCDADECAERPVDAKPEKIYLHPKYSQRTFQNDIALIKLKEPVKYTKWIRPICLPYGDLLNKDFIGSSGDVAGWGIADLSENIGSDILQTVKLPILGVKNCQKHYKKVAISEDSNLCAGGVLGKDSCGGDSGGPLMKVEVFNGPPRYFLIGVVSFGSKLCAQSTVPAVYTRISYYMPWILENLSKC